MSVSLFVAPGAAGKTRYALQVVRSATTDLRHKARVCVANRQQLLSWQRRLAHEPQFATPQGAIGVEVMTFDHLYAACLDAIGSPFTRIEDAVEYRLIRDIVAQLPLQHYGSLRNRPGFIQELQRLIGELKSTRITPAQLTNALAATGAEPRLLDLARIYERYDQILREQRWADYPGLGWMAVQALENGAPHALRDWPLLIVDGFDSFTQTQLSFLEHLAQPVDRLVITLTGVNQAAEPRRVHRRFHRTLRELEKRFDIQAGSLPRNKELERKRGALNHLQENLFLSEATPIPDDGVVQMVEAPHPAAEVREALRWLKQRLIEDGARPHELALLARDLEPYTPFIRQTAAEFELPVHIVEGLPLVQNPCVAALLNLLRLALPAPATAGVGGGGENSTGEPALPRRELLSALRSPYFDWANGRPPRTAESGPVDMTTMDINNLENLARHWRVVGGRSQWLEALEAAAAQPGRKADIGLPAGEDARQLLHKFNRFLACIHPPSGPRACRDYVAWLDALLGHDQESVDAGQTPEGSLAVAARLQAEEDVTARRDRAALHRLKLILRSLLWAEEVGILNRPLTYSDFVEELTGAVEATRYQPHDVGQAILASEVTQARGVPFRAVAVLGLAEGVFPQPLTEDAFLRENDRQVLRDEHGFPLESSVESAEAEYFYEAIIRPWDRLLLTRPRLAEGGAVWQPSPFWDEVKRLVEIEPRRVETEEVPPPHRAASRSELLESLCLTPESAALDWCEQQWPGRWQRLLTSSDHFYDRYEARQSPHDGLLRQSSSRLGRAFGQDYVWSATRLERYLTCPFYFFVGDVLQKEARIEPEEGLDARQLGSIYHRILEQVYRRVPPHSRNDIRALQAALEEVAPAILDRAPRREGFRVTAWWQQTRQEITENVRQTLQAMADDAGPFTPAHFELRFFGQNALRVTDPDHTDAFYLHGIIDRVDVDDEGSIRIVDYKTAGPYNFRASALQNGRKIQLALYALAAQEALQLGQIVDGFYWHVQHAEASGLKLGEVGPQEAMAMAREHAWRAIRGVQAGNFTPQPPSEGCPSYCPAAAFCWHYAPRNW